MRTKEEAEENISRLDTDLSNLKFEGMASSDAESLLDESVEAFSQGRFRDALDLSLQGRKALDVEAQQIIGSRFLHMREIIDLGYTYPPESILDGIHRGELAMSTDISEAAMIADSLRDDIRDHLLDSRLVLRRIVEENIREEDRSPELYLALDALDDVKGELEEVKETLGVALREIEAIYENIAASVRAEQVMVERALRDIGPIAGMWDQAEASKRRGDYRQAFDTLYRIGEELQSLLQSGISFAYEFVSYRHEILIKKGVTDETVSALLGDMGFLMENDPNRALEIFVRIDEMLESYESDIVSRRIDSLSEMIAVGRRVGYDISPVILGLDEARMILADGDLEGSMDKISEVEELLRETMPGFMEMRDSFRDLEDLTEELQEYDLDYTEVEKRADWGREMALRGDFQGAHEMIREAIGILGDQAKEIIADVVLDCQIGLLSGFRMEADMEAEGQILESIFAEIEAGKYNRKVEEAEELSKRIDGRLMDRAEEVISELEMDIDSHTGHIEVRPYREMMKEAQQQIGEGLYEQAYITVWTARKKITGQLFDAVERSRRKIKDLISTAEYVNVDVAPLRREMYGLVRIGRQPVIEDLNKALDLEDRISRQVAEELHKRVEDLHINVGKLSMGGVHLRGQLEKLKRARRELEAGDLRRGHELSREAKIEFEMARILHDEVYSHMLNLARIAEREEDTMGLEKALLLFHDGKYRDADIYVKRLIRKIIDQGSEASAREILRMASSIQDAGEELGLNVTALRESYPQAEFFIENEDYKLASSLMEKAIRAGRSEIVGSFKEIVPRLRDEVEGIKFRKEEEQAVLEMVERAEYVAAGPEPESALDIITALQRETSRRRELISMTNERLRHNQILVREAERTGYQVDSQSDIMEHARGFLRSGRFCLANGLAERAVDQISEMIGFFIRSMTEDMDFGDLAGPDLENDLKTLEPLMELVEERRFRAASDITGDIERAKERTAHKRAAVHQAIEELEQRGVAMLDEGMYRDRVDAAIEQVREWESNGTFVSAYILAKSHLINLDASLDSYRRLRPRVDRFRQMMAEAPEGWIDEEVETRLEDAVATISKGDSEEGFRMFMALEDAVLRRIQDNRFRHMESMVAMGMFLGSPPSHPDNDHDLVSLHSEMHELCLGRLQQFESKVEDRGGHAGVLLSRYEDLVAAGELIEAEWVINLAVQCQGLDEDVSLRLEEAMEACRKELERADSEGFRVDELLSTLWEPSDAQEMIAFCKRTINQMEKARFSLVPQLDIDFRKGYLYVSNNRSAVAIDVRLDGRHLVDKLGIGESVRYPAIKGRGLALVSYQPILSSLRRTKRVLI